MKTKKNLKNMKNSRVELEIRIIRFITKYSHDYDEKLMKIKFSSDDELPLNKAIETPIMTVVVRAVFHENNKYYLHVFLDECLHKI